MNSEKTIIVILLLALIGVGGFSWYTIGVIVPQKAQSQCEAYIKGTVVPQAEAQCKQGVAQLQAGLQQCMTQAEQCGTLVTALKQVPTCAPYIPTEGQAEAGEAPAGN